MKALPPLMALGGIKRPEGPTIQPRRLRRPRPRSVPTMAWTVLLIGLLAVGSGQGPGLCILGGHLRGALRILSPWQPLSPVILGVDSQTVIQEPVMSVSLGGTVTLTCAFSSGSVTTSNYPSWFQQTPGQPPRLLIYYTNSRPTGVPSRFSGAISGNKATLTITGAQAEDEADYFCALYKGSGTYT